MSSIDVVMPCYSYGRYLSEAVHSVLSQGVEAVRVLIIDDASPDDSAEIAGDLARQDARITFHRHPVNRGHIRTYNEGIEWAGADCTLLLSADDYLLPGSLKRALGLMEQHPQAGFVFGDALLVWGDGTSVRTESPVACHLGGSVIFDGVQFMELCRRRGGANIVPTPTVVVRTELQKRVGGYRPELPHSGDLEMWLRLAAHASVCYVHCDQAVYRRHAANMSLEYGKSNALCDLQQRKAAFDCFLDACAEQRPELVQVHEELLRALARGAIGMASEAFNDNCRDLCERIEAFAVGLDPRVTQAPAWKRLALKKRLGWRVSRALLAAMSAMRVRPAPWIQGARSQETLP